MSEILLGQSYFMRFDHKLWQAMQPYPPLGSLYAASYLRQRGYPVALFDAMLAESESEWEQALEHHNPRYAVLFEDNFNYLSKMCLLRMRQAALTMIAMARQRGCSVILCGADATDHAELYLQNGADYVILGEGEQTLSELLDTLSGRATGDPGEIAGLVSRSTKSPTRRPDLRDLDALPFPAWDLVDIGKYRQLWIENHGFFSMNMVTTRGCPFHCNWCAKPIWGQRYNSRSPQNVVDELRWLVDTYRPDHIWFADDIFGLKPGWTHQYADLLEGQNLHIPFKCLSRVDLLLRPGEVEALSKAGAQIVWVGAESGSQKILDAMEKGTRIEQIQAAARLLHNHDLQVGFFLQFGYPGETLSDIEETLRMVRRCQPDDIGISVSYPLPGTKFYRTVQHQLQARQNWVDSQDLAMLYQGPFSTPFYRQLHTVVHKQFRVHKALTRLREHLGPSSRQRLRAGILSSSRPPLLRTLAGMLYHALTLPVARWRLKRLQSAPHQPAVDELPHMPYEAAASPTPQAD